MANIPYNPVPDVTPTVGGTGAQYQSAEGATPNAFGAGIGQAVEGVGEQVQKQAEYFQNIYTESTARDATTKTAVDMANEQARFFQLKGNDAVNGFKDHQDRLNQIVKDNSSGLSIIANEMYQRDSASLVNNAIFKAGAHVGEQAEQAHLGSLKGSIEVNSNLYAQNADNPTGQSYINAALHAAGEHAAASGLEGDAKVAYMTATSGQILSSAIKARVQGDPDGAQRLFDYAKGSFNYEDIDKNGNKVTYSIPRMDAAQFAQTTAEMQGEFKNQARDALWDANSSVQEGQDYNKPSVIGALLRAGHSKEDAQAHVNRLDNMLEDFGSSNARYDIVQTLKNNEALSLDGRNPTPIDPNLVSRAFRKEPDRAQDVLDQYAMQQKVASIMAARTTNTLQQNRELVASLAPTESSAGSSLYNLGNVKTSSGAANNTADFVNPSTPTDGVILAANNLRSNYQGLTLEQIGAKWTGEPNKTAEWVKAASQHSGIAPDAIPNLNDPTQLKSILKGINVAENSLSKASLFTDDIISKGIESSLAGKAAETSKGGNQNYAEQLAVYNKVSSAMDDYYNKQLYPDAAGTITRNDVKLNAMYQDAATDTKNPQKMNDYVNEVSKRQEALGIPDDVRSVLPAAYAQQLVQNMMKVPAELPTQLRKMQAEYGSNYQKVYQDLVNKGGLAQDAQIASHVDSNPDPSLAQYAPMGLRIGSDDGSKGKTNEVLMGGKTSYDTMTKAIAGNTMVNSLLHSFAASNASSTDLIKMQTSIENLAVGIHTYALTQTERDNAAELAIRAVTGQYNFMSETTGGARIPVAKTQTVEYNAFAKAMTISDDDVSPNQKINNYADRKSYIESLRTSPTWITDEANNRIVLSDDHGQPVFDRTGKRIAIGFDDPQTQWRPQTQSIYQMVSAPQPEPEDMSGKNQPVHPEKGKSILEMLE